MQFGNPFARLPRLDRPARREPAPADNTPVVRPTPVVKSLAELRQRVFPPRRWIVEGLLQEGSCLILAGKGKIGKSFLVLSVAVAVGTGGRVLGHLHAETCDVLYLCLEDGEELLQERTEQMLVNDPDADVSRIKYADSWAPLSDGGLEDLENYLYANRDTRLVIVDTLKRVKGASDGNDRRQLYDIDYDSLGPLTDIAHRHRIAIVVVHHTKKGEAEDPMDLISGSIGLSASVDGAMILTRKRLNNDAELSVYYRGAEDRAYSLYRDDLTRGWVWAGDAEQRRLSAEREAVIEVMRVQRRPMKPREVAEAMDRLHQVGNIGRLMNTMLEQGQLVQSRYGMYELPRTESVTPDNNGQRMSGERWEIIATIAAHGQSMRPSDVATALGRPHDAGNIQRLMNTMMTDGQLSQPKYGQYGLPEQNSDRTTGPTDLALGLYTAAKTGENSDPSGPTDLAFRQNRPYLPETLPRSDSTQTTRITRIADSHVSSGALIQYIRDGGGAVWIDDRGNLAWSPPSNAPPDLEGRVNSARMAILAALRYERQP